MKKVPDMPTQKQAKASALGGLAGLSGRGKVAPRIGAMPPRPGPTVKSVTNKATNLANTYMALRQKTPSQKSNPFSGPLAGAGQGGLRAKPPKATASTASTVRPPARKGPPGKI